MPSIRPVTILSTNLPKCEILLQYTLNGTKGKTSTIIIILNKSVIYWHLSFWI